VGRTLLSAKGVNMPAASCGKSRTGTKALTSEAAENLGFVSGHDFSRAVNCENVFAFSRWGQNFCPTFLFFRSVLDERYSRN